MLCNVRILRMLGASLMIMVGTPFGPGSIIVLALHTETDPIKDKGERRECDPESEWAKPVVHTVPLGKRAAGVLCRPGADVARIAVRSGMAPGRPGRGRSRPECAKG